VKDARVAPLGVTAIHDIHIWARRHIRYEPDIVDNWAQPFETLGWRRGDCEDISILERALLIAAGYSSDQMWLVIVYDLITHDIHAMLIVGRFLLDSRTDKITYVAEAKDYQPIIAFSDNRAVTFGRSVK
jgi:predicted transglutaminase-like cysteine proteinase